MGILPAGPSCCGERGATNSRCRVCMLCCAHPAPALWRENKQSWRQSKCFSCKFLLRSLSCPTHHLFSHTECSLPSRSARQGFRHQSCYVQLQLHLYIRTSHTYPAPSSVSAGERGSLSPSSIFAQTWMNQWSKALRLVSCVQYNPMCMRSRGLFQGPRGEKASSVKCMLPSASRLLQSASCRVQEGREQENNVHQVQPT